MDTDKTITLGSLFDGIGGFPYAASFFGIKPLWASEILPQAISVTRRHFPRMEHAGDITSLDGAELAPVDIITFGSPCQDLSVAGRRAGLTGARSGLFTEAVRIINEMRRKTNGRYPSFAVWENVPGALSSAGGRDFASVLEAFAKAEVPVPVSGRWAGAGMVRGDGVDIAWRVLNACLWRVPQRRRRVFLVADFGSGRAGKILFVEQSLRGYPAPGGQARKGAAADASGGAFGSVPDGVRAPAGSCSLSFAVTMRLREGCKGGGKGPLLQKERSGALATHGDQYLFAPTLTFDDHHSAATLFNRQRFDLFREQDVASTQAASQCKGATDIICKDTSGTGHKESAHAGYIVRRLTPTECERLQGFPDGWTRLGVGGEEISDTRRYQMLGNSLAIPCAAFVLGNIAARMGGTAGRGGEAAGDTNTNINIETTKEVL